jgi:hypothetical protein
MVQLETVIFVRNSFFCCFGINLKDLFVMRLELMEGFTSKADILKLSGSKYLISFEIMAGL